MKLVELILAADQKWILGGNDSLIKISLNLQNFLKTEFSKNFKIKKFKKKLK
jgi:hypothetical protein